MAVYEGARQPAIALPRRPALDLPALPRRRIRAATRAGRRPSRLAMALGGIVLAFVCAFFSLAQDVRVSAAGYELDSLSADHDRLEAQVLDLRSQVNRLGRAPAIRKHAIDAGMGPLAKPLIVAGN